MHEFVGRFWLDISALISSVVVLIFGSYLGWYGSAVWFNRSGSVIIVIGVLVAACRFHDRMRAQLSEKAEANQEALYEKVRLELEAELGKPTEHKHDRELRLIVRKRFQSEIETLVETEKQRIKLLEIFLIVGGTLLNGFGDYLVCLLKACS
jgi:hypothetical protein